MSSTAAPPRPPEDSIALRARRIATAPGIAPRGTRQTLVRINDELRGLIEEVKPPDQPLAAYLRDCAVRCALVALEATTPP